MAVQEGAKAYLRRQYTIIAGVAVVLAIVLAIGLEAQDANGILVAIGFLIGGTFSGAAGFIGMNVSVRANARVAESARSGVSKALEVAFKGGAITGMLVAGLALLGVAGYYGVLILAGTEERDAIDALIGLGFGGSLISVFARLGGGIFTKAADVGADLVGKIEAGHPGGRPAQPGGDRGQRGRQRRRLRRHGRRPLRDLRRDGGGGDAAGRPDLPGDRDRRDVPARDRRRLAHRLDHRHLRGAQPRRERGAGALPGPDRVRSAGRDRLPADHAADDGRPLATRRASRTCCVRAPTRPRRSSCGSARLSAWA